MTTPEKAVRIIENVKYRESCRESFRELRLLTLPCLYIFEVIMYVAGTFINMTLEAGTTFELINAD
ncbi:hypothetical protein J6590_098972 [Homalodisca vitripennis]|nr:hypothetical protein J6590_098972 [Homalodisca vitripennis]